MLAALDSGAAAISAAVETNLAAGAETDAAQAEIISWASSLRAQCRAGRAELNAVLPNDDEAASGMPLPTLRQLASGGPAGSEAGDRARSMLRALADTAARAGALAYMEQSFLYDDARHLMTIGYNVEERRVDTGYYDLLASEARLGVFVAIAQGQIGQESWFALGRLLTSAAGTPVLLSWSGSMFEYLMPMLLMPSYENTLLDQTCRGAVQRQIEFGDQHGVPWGISESGYNGFDTALNYQYRAFGVPGLGLKRGLADDLVVAPYASMMALMVAPEQACENLQRLSSIGAAGRHGLYEAIDFTRRACRAGRRARWCARSWRTIRAWACWRWRTCCWSDPCSGTSRPIPRCRPPSCCCRSACRGR
jgi:cyclic beta-1,2-glucan synthetase